ncbi:nucleotide exchange factor GrpE [bacterium]|uniref:Protein GrpE n=2 Tax=Katanobacteria TaxID=422282 RepID=A0A2M7X0B6_UNCKA|nr:nucleotide exchange factor GrpE [bacterium]PIP56270.1 MAG: hypothetical protein COX05_03990 [candidate division WWE3 bacterium CG22_combo_CG10-13_8_21_14_all_39_12]PJA39336.1 MAG: hypothetical protein CO179_05405 [candidate division WWE3 bacterium CG_4_9_14_3_um_filter_39_7]
MDTPSKDPVTTQNHQEEQLETQIVADSTSNTESQLKRALADYDNLKKRFEKEKEDVIKYSNQAMIMNLISVVDGLSMTLARFTTILAHEGFLEKKVQIGDTFDPQIMEATETDGKGDTVTKVYNSAYTLHDKLIRPARVKVGGDK